MQTKLKKLFKFSPPELPLQSLQEFESYLWFINLLEIPVKLTHAVAVVPHASSSMAGWQGIHSLTCLGEDRQLYDIDIRYAWGSEIFKQNLVDHGWSEATLLHKKDKQEPTRHKLIIYLCEDSTNLDTNHKIESVPDRFLIGGYWQSIHHIYLLLPVEHPFDIPDFNVKTSIASYSTTRCVTKNQPKIVNVPDSKIVSHLFIPNNSDRKGEGGLRTKGLWKQSTPEQPLVSVITVVFNGAKYIEQTIQSVINQLYDNMEYIIIDGGSTDETIEIIRKYEYYIDYWVSEPDQGIYHAMNKGLQYATGEFVLFLNSDDWLELGVISKVTQIIKEKPDYDVYHGHLLIHNDHQSARRKIAHGLLPTSIPAYQPTSLIRRQSIKTKYWFDSQYKVAADFKFFKQIQIQGFRFLSINILISHFSSGGASSNFQLRLSEIKNILLELNYNKALVVLLLWRLEMLNFVHRLAQQLLSKRM